MKHHSSSIFFTIIAITTIAANVSWAVVPNQIVPLKLHERSDAAQTTVALAPEASPLISFLEKETGQVWTGYSRADGFAAWRVFGSGLQVPLPNTEEEAFSTGRQILDPLLPLVYGAAPQIVPLAAHHTGGGWYVFYRQIINDIQVDESLVSVHIDRFGRVTSLRLGIVDPKPIRTFGGHDINYARQAVERLTGGKIETVKPVWLVQDGNFSTGPTVKAAFRVECDVTFDFKPLLYIDEESGSILAGANRVFFDTSRVSAEGTTRPMYLTDSSQTQPFRDLSVTIAGSTAYTDTLGKAYRVRSDSGTFTATANLTGHFVNVTPSSVTRTSRTATGLSPLLLNFTVPPAIIAEPNVYYHINIMHAWYKEMDPTFTGIDYAMPALVGIVGYANADWDGNGVNFGDGGSTFYDMGMFADVVYHEYTHGMTARIYNSSTMPNSTFHEGWSDYFACALCGDPLEGDGVSRDGTPYLRILVNNLRTPNDITGEGHYDGQIISGAMWDTRMLVGTHYCDSLFHNARHGLATNFQDYLTDVLEYDDNDGNLINGTPHMAGIVPSFARHGITLTFTPHLGTVAGVITRFRDNLPVANATVRVEGSNDTARTDSTGHYVLHSYGSTCHLVASSPSYYPMTVPVTIIADSTVSQNFVFRTTGYVSGLVSSSLTTLPIPNVTVHITNGADSTTTDSTGHYVFPSLLPVCYLQIAAHGFIPWQDSVVVLPDSTVTFNISLAQPLAECHPDSLFAELSPNGQDTVLFATIHNTGNGQLTWNSQLLYSGSFDEADSVWDQVFTFNATQAVGGDRQLNGIAFDGRNFWISGANNYNFPHKLYKLDKFGTLLGSFNCPDSTGLFGWRGLAWDGHRYLYASYSTHIDKIDTANGLVVQRYLTLINPARSIAIDTAGGVLYCADQSSPIYKIRLSDGVLLATLPSPHPSGGLFGLSWYPNDVDGMKLYVIVRDSPDNSRGSRLYKINTLDSTSHALQSLGLPNESVSGLAITPYWNPMLWTTAEILNNNSTGCRVAMNEVAFNTVWIQYSPQSDTLLPGQTDTITVGLRSEYMPEDRYRVAIRFNTNTVNQFVTIPVVMNVGQNSVTATEVKELPTKFALEQNYPNPFNPTTQVSFTLPKTSHVNLIVYNTLGREVARVISNQLYQAGHYRVAIDGTKWATGVYFYRIQSGSFIATRKMVLIK